MPETNLFPHREIPDEAAVEAKENKSKRRTSSVHLASPSWPRILCGFVFLLNTLRATSQLASFLVDWLVNFPLLCTVKFGRSCCNLQPRGHRSAKILLAAKL